MPLNLLQTSLRLKSTSCNYRNQVLAVNIVNRLQVSITIVRAMLCYSAIKVDVL